MELHLLNPPNLRSSSSSSSFTLKSSSYKINPSSRGGSNNPHQPESLQFRKFSKKDLSRILRTESAIKAIEKKANSNSSSKYNNLWPKAVLEALYDAIKHNRWDSALKIFDLLRKQHWYEPRTQTYAKLLVMLGKCKQPNEATLIFEIMLSDGLQPTVDVYTALVGAYTLNGLFDKAFSIVNSMKSIRDYQVMGLKPDIVTYNILIKSYGNSGLDEKMGSVMEFMKKRFFSPTIVTYNILVEIFGKARDIEKMDEIFLKMKHQGLKPNSITYSSLVCAYSKAGLLEKVDSILRQVESSDVALDTTFFNCIINAYGNAGDVERMKELFMAMEGCGCKPDTITFATMIQAFRAVGMIEAAQSLESNFIHSKNVSGSRDGNRISQRLLSLLTNPEFHEGPNCRWNTTQGSPASRNVMLLNHIEMHARAGPPRPPYFTILGRNYLR
ncbi:hypothetical protein BUALT_Bualt19G0040900 [Buddleja alternifolia]|uniref:Pentatricopeptide repeat-containing protein n=1 Tax=Buddleja alternifolia TaxID=168488 RepID=A0AAV6W9C8_9LAMI|nr:hypothetical protein BUALT_Bualt19G0040900 [Buddleja alternifolia]